MCVLCGYLGRTEPIQSLPKNVRRFEPPRVGLKQRAAAARSSLPQQRRNHRAVPVSSSWDRYLLVGGHGVGLERHSLTANRWS